MDIQFQSLACNSKSTLLLGNTEGTGLRSAAKQHYIRDIQSTHTDSKEVIEDNDNLNILRVMNKKGLIK